MPGLDTVVLVDQGEQRAARGLDPFRIEDRFGFQKVGAISFHPPGIGNGAGLAGEALVLACELAGAAIGLHVEQQIIGRLVGDVGVVVVGSLGLVVVGPTVLSIVGPEYRTQGQGLLYLAAAFIPLSAVGAIYEGFARVQRKLKLMIVAQSIATVLIVGGSLASTKVLGIVGVGWAYLAAEGVTAVILLPPVIVWFRRALAQGLSIEDGSTTAPEKAWPQS